MFRKKYIFSITTAIILFMLTVSFPALAGESTGVIRQFDTFENYRLLKPVFTDNSIYLATDNGIVYKLDSDLKNERNVNINGQIVAMECREDRIFLLLSDESNIHSLRIFDSEDLSEISKIQNVTWDKLIPSGEYLFALNSEKIAIIDKNGQETGSIAIPGNNVKNIISDASYITVISEDSQRYSAAVFDTKFNLVIQHFPSDVLFYNAEVIITGNRQNLDSLSIIDIKGNLVRQVNLPENMNHASENLFYRDGSLYITAEKNNQIFLVKLDCETGEVQWKTYITHGYTGKLEGLFVLSGDYAYVILEGWYPLVLNVNTNDGSVLNCYVVPNLHNIKITTGNGKLYFTGDGTSPGHPTAGIIEVNPELSGRETVATPRMKSYLHNVLNMIASEYVPEFKKHLFDKGKTNLASATDIWSSESALKYKEAYNKNPKNPYFKVYEILALLESGKDTVKTKTDIDNLLLSQRSDTYFLVSAGTIFSRFGYREIGRDFLNEAVKSAPSISPDYKRTTIWALSSPVLPLFNSISSFFHSVQGHPVDTGVFEGSIENLEYIEKISPWNEVNYPAWASLSQKFRNTVSGNIQKQASEKASGYFSGNPYIPYYRLAAYEFLSVLSLVMGMVFIVLSIWFIIQGFMRKRKFLESKTSGEKIPSIPELFNSMLTVREKNVLGFMLSIGLVSLISTIVMLFLSGGTNGSNEEMFILFMTVSLLTGVVVALYLVIAGYRIRLKHREKFPHLTGTSIPASESRSFLSFISGREKSLLLTLSIIGIIFPVILSFIISPFVNLANMSSSTISGYYGDGRTIYNLRKELDINPGNDSALLMLGYGYLQRKDYRNAVDIFEKYLETNPEDNTARINQAIALFYVNPEKALQIMEELRGLPVESDFEPRLKYNLETMKFRMDKITEQDLRQSLEDIDDETVKSYLIYKTGEFLEVPPSWNREKQAFLNRINPMVFIYSYFMPAAGTGVFEYPLENIRNNILTGIALPVLSFIWTIALLFSLVAFGDNKISLKTSLHNISNKKPGIISAIIPGVYQVSRGYTARGAFYLITFIYSLVMLYKTYWYGLNNSQPGNFLSPAGYDFLSNYLLHDFNAATAPGYSGYLSLIIAISVIIFIINITEILKPETKHKLSNTMTEDESFCDEVLSDNEKAL
jgi:tetratricopeptide (TPR) repeat protein